MNEPAGLVPLPLDVRAAASSVWAACGDPFADAGLGCACEDASRDAVNVAKCDVDGCSGQAENVEPAAGSARTAAMQCCAALSTLLPANFRQSRSDECKDVAATILHARESLDSACTALGSVLLSARDGGLRVTNRGRASLALLEAIVAVAETLARVPHVCVCLSAEEAEVEQVGTATGKPNGLNARWAWQDLLTALLLRMLILLQTVKAALSIVVARVDDTCSVSDKVLERGYEQETERLLLLVTLPFAACAPLDVNSAVFASSPQRTNASAEQMCSAVTHTQEKCSQPSTLADAVALAWAGSSIAAGVGGLADSDWTSVDCDTARHKAKDRNQAGTQKEAKMWPWMCRSYNIEASIATLHVRMGRIIAGCKDTTAQSNDDVTAREDAQQVVRDLRNCAGTCPCGPLALGTLGNRSARVMLARHHRYLLPILLQLANEWRPNLTLAAVAHLCVPSRKLIDGPKWRYLGSAAQNILPWLCGAPASRGAAILAAGMEVFGVGALSPTSAPTSTILNREADKDKGHIARFCPLGAELVGARLLPLIFRLCDFTDSPSLQMVGLAALRATACSLPRPELVWHRAIVLEVLARARMSEVAPVARRAVEVTAMVTILTDSAAATTAASQTLGLMQPTAISALGASESGTGDGAVSRRRAEQDPTHAVVGELIDELRRGAPAIEIGSQNDNVHRWCAWLDAISTMIKPLMLPHSVRLLSLVQPLMELLLPPLLPTNSAAVDDKLDDRDDNEDEAEFYAARTYTTGMALSPRIEARLLHLVKNLLLGLWPRTARFTGPVVRAALLVVVRHATILAVTRNNIKSDGDGGSRPLHVTFTSAAALELVKEVQKRASGACLERQQQTDSESTVQRRVEMESAAETERIVRVHLNVIAAAGAACDAAARVACAPKSTQGVETELEAIAMLRAVATTATMPLLCDIAAQALEVCGAPLTSANTDVDIDKEPEHEHGHFEWLVCFEDLEPQLRELFNKYALEPGQVQALVLGSGTSALSAKLILSGLCSHVVSVDNEQECVRQMQNRYADDSRFAPGTLQWLCADLNDESEHGAATLIKHGSFDLVLDKSTLDAMLCDDASGLLCTAAEALRCNGIYVIVSLYGEKLLRKLLAESPLGSADEAHNAACDAGESQATPPEIELEFEHRYMPVSTAAPASAGIAEAELMARDEPVTGTSISLAVLRRRSIAGVKPRQRLSVCMRPRVHAHFASVLEWYHTEQAPLLTVAREAQLRAAFRTACSGRIGASARLPLRQAYMLMFSESERSEYHVVDFIGDFASHLTQSNPCLHKLTCTGERESGDVEKSLLICADEAVAFLRENQ